MLTYIIQRLLLMVPTLLAILVVVFIITQFVPGGPVERIIARMTNEQASSATSRVGGGTSGEIDAGGSGMYRGAQGVDEEFIAELNRQFGLDEPAHVRFFMLLTDYLRFDLGESFSSGKPVVQLILEKMPVSMSLGIPSFILAYAISIPLGIRKAVRDGTAFDAATSGIVIAGYAVPGFLFAVLLIVLFGGGSFWNVFPLRGLHSDVWRGVSFSECAAQMACVTDYLWHLVLPVASLSIGGFAILTMLTKNAFLDEMHKQYTVVARSKGIREHRVLYPHVFWNAMILVISGIPSAVVGMFLTGALLIEVLFSLDGLGLLSYTAVIDRDYPVVLGLLYIFVLIRLILNLVTDLTYAFIDPRITFKSIGG